MATINLNCGKNRAQNTETQGSANWRTHNGSIGRSIGTSWLLVGTACASGCSIGVFGKGLEGTKVVRSRFNGVDGEDHSGTAVVDLTTVSPDRCGL